MKMMLRATSAPRQQPGLMKRGRGNLLSALAILFASVTSALGAPAAGSPREQVVKIVTQIRRADYEGDRAALRRLYGELTPFPGNKELASRVRYWRGFALWRRAINGFNEDVPVKELQDDLQQGLEEFNEAAKQDATFTDARVGSLGCLSLIGFIKIQGHPDWKNDPDFRELSENFTQLRKEIEAAAPENPRFLWVMGPSVWKTPPEKGGGEAKAIEMYEKGLEAIRKNRVKGSDALEVSWGEPELLMNLAFTYLDRTASDPDAAERYAQSALDLVPYWHYVKDILMPQIRTAKQKHK